MMARKSWNPETVFKVLVQSISQPGLSEALAVMHTPIYNFVAQGFMCTLGELIIDEGIGSHLDALVIACPLLRPGQKLAADSAMAVILGHIPTLDVAYWL